jgi:hypothetical protein
MQMLLINSSEMSAQLVERAEVTAVPLFISLKLFGQTELITIIPELTFCIMRRVARRKAAFAPASSAHTHTCATSGGALIV